MKKLLKRHLPPAVWDGVERAKKGVERPFISTLRHLVAIFGYNIVRANDYYSPLPLLNHLKKHRSRWDRPSALAGVNFDLAAYKTLLTDIMAAYYAEFSQLPSYNQITQRGFGPGYTELDALTLYLMVRHYKPCRYLEIGSGVSTYYCSLAAAQNAKENHPLAIQCIEPYPFEQLYRIPGIQVRADEVQNVELAAFQELQAGDILFIDSSHILKIDGDVPYLFLEVLPNLSQGVLIHVHDIPFPYNTPYPAEHWVLGRSWPMYWNEAMVLQAFLAFNQAFQTVLSLPMLRHFDEPFLRQCLPNYKPVAQEANTFSSIWLQKVE
jgi:predicted O-methyltransferase YrrM